MDRPPSPTTPRAAASSSAHTTWSARERGRRGRSHATRATTDAASGAGREHLARRQLGEHVERHPARLGGEDARQLGCQGVLCLPAGIASRRPGREPGSSRARRRPGSSTGRPRCVRPTCRRCRWAATPAPARCRRRWRASPPPRPARPAVRRWPRRRAAGWRPPSARARRGRRCAARSAARCPSGRAAARPDVPPRTPRRPRPGRPAHWSRADVAISGTASTGLARGAAAAQRQGHLAGNDAAPRPRAAPAACGASSSSAGVAASSGSTVWRADPAVAWPPLSSTCSSIARASAPSSARRRSTSAAAGASADTGCTPLTRPRRRPRDPRRHR